MVIVRLEVPVSSSRFVAVIFTSQFVEVSNQLIEWSVHVHYDADIATYEDSSAAARIDISKW